MLKENLVKQFRYCNAIANDIVEHNKSKEIQEYAKQFAEIESPLVGGTDADWIRINWGDIYIFLCDNGSIGYQVDPLGAYGSELIDMWNCTENDFVKEILSLEAAPIVRDGITFFEAEESVKWILQYYLMEQKLITFIFLKNQKRNLLNYSVNYQEKQLVVIVGIERESRLQIYRNIFLIKGMIFYRNSQQKL